MRLLPMLVHFFITMAGLTCLYLAWQTYQKTRMLLSEGVVTTATVIENLAEASDDSDVYRPKFRYTNQQHQPVEFTGSIASNPPAWKVGETSLMVYRPDQVRSERLLSYWNLHRVTILLTALAAPLLVIGLGYFLFHLYARDLAHSM